MGLDGQVAPHERLEAFTGLLHVLSAFMELFVMVPGACFLSSLLILEHCSLSWFACLQSVGTVLSPMQTSEHMAELAWTQAHPS